MSARPDLPPEYRIALDEHRLAVERLSGAKSLVVAAVLRRPRVAPWYARLVVAQPGDSRPSILDRLVSWLVHADAQRAALAANDELVSALRAHADACAHWLAYRESILMALEADPTRPGPDRAATRSDGSHEEAA